MTRFIYDQFSKDYLDELLSPYGELKTGYTVASERREIDVYFQPYSSQLPEGLGILGKIACQRCTFEPYRNPVTDLQIRACFGKVCDVEGNIIRESNRQKQPLKKEDLPYLWILTPTASNTLLSGFRTETLEDWGEGIYCAGESWRMGIVVIHRFPVTDETLFLRLPGRGKVQTRAIEQVDPLVEDNPFL